MLAILRRFPRVRSGLVRRDFIRFFAFRVRDRPSVAAFPCMVSPRPVPAVRLRGWVV